MSNSEPSTDDFNPYAEAGEIDESSPEVKKVRQADLVLSPILILLGLWTAYDSFLMSRKAVLAGQATIATSPGLFPFITSVLLVACMMFVLLHALRTRPSLEFLTLSYIRSHFAKFDSWITIIVIGMFAIYVFGMLGRMPFELATFVYLVAMMMVFRATKLWISVVVAASYTFCLAFAFTQWAATILPKSIFN